MTDEKKSIFSKLFGGKKSGCCGLKIEEVPEPQDEKAPEAQQKESLKKNQTQQGSCCCGPLPGGKK